MNSLRTTVIALLAGVLLVGCNRTPSHVDALPSPTGTLDVLRFETAWGEDSLQLTERQWREVEAVIDEGLDRWEQWVNRDWVGFVDDVWVNNGQEWQDDSETTERLVRRAASLRRTAAAIDAETVARIGMVAGAPKRDAAHRLANQRKLEYARAIATGYGSDTGTPRLAESLLESRGLSLDAASAMRRVFSRTAHARALLLDRLVDLRFEAVLFAAGEKNKEREARIAAVKADLAAAIEAIELANDSAVTEALSIVDAIERESLEYQWLRGSSDPDANYRRLGDVAFDVMLRLRSNPPGKKSEMRAVQAEWERVDATILARMKKIRRERLALQATGKSSGGMDKAIRGLRQERGKVFWEVFGQLEGIAKTEDFHRAAAFIKELPDQDTAMRQLSNLVGVSDAEAIVATIPIELFGSPSEAKRERLINSSALDLVLSDPIDGKDVRGIFRRSSDSMLLVVSKLHDEYEEAYRLLYEARVDDLKASRERVSDSTKEEADFVKFGQSVASFLAHADTVRAEFAALDEKLFDDLSSVGGELMLRDLLLARERRSRTTADLVLESDSDFMFVFLGPGRVEFANVISEAGLSDTDRFEADGILLDQAAMLLEIRELHRKSSLEALVAIFSDYGRRSIDESGSATRSETAVLTESVLRPSRHAAEQGHEELFRIFADRLTPDGFARIHMGWQLACFPVLEQRFAPDLSSRIGEGLARLVAFGHLESRVLSAGEVAVLDALLKEWMVASTAMLDKAFQLRRQTTFGEGSGLRRSWFEIFRRYPRFRVLDVRRQELDARTARQVISILGPKALALPWVKRAIEPDYAQTSWARSN